MFAGNKKQAGFINHFLIKKIFLSISLEVNITMSAAISYMYIGRRLYFFQKALKFFPSFR